MTEWTVMFRSAVTIKLAGTLDQARLDALRSALRLRPEGRLSDAWDEIQGRRTDEVTGGRLQILLYRDDVAGPWAFHVNVEGEPSEPALRAVEQELTAAATANGLSVTGVVRRS
jgi:hypothetical protein